MINKENEPSMVKALRTLFEKIKDFFEVLIKHIKRFWEVLSKKVEDYKTSEEAVGDAKYLTRINIVIITISVIIILFNLGRIVWLILGHL